MPYFILGMTEKLWTSFNSNRWLLNVLGMTEKLWTSFNSNRWLLNNEVRCCSFKVRMLLHHFSLTSLLTVLRVIFVFLPALIKIALDPPYRSYYKNPTRLYISFIMIVSGTVSPAFNISTCDKFSRDSKLSFHVVLDRT